MSTVAALVLTACEDYTEHNFGKDSELWQPVEVQNHKFELGRDQAVPVGADPVEFLGAKLPSLLKNKFYSLTSGSTVTIQYEQEVTFNGDAYVPYKESIKAGKYLLSPKGLDQVFCVSDAGKTYGYIYLTGNTAKVPTYAAITRVNADCIEFNNAATACLYTIAQVGDAWTIANPEGKYLYMKGKFDSFNFADDLATLDDTCFPYWTITLNEDGTYDITNTGNQKVILFGTTYASAGAYAGKKGTEGHLGIRLFSKGSTTLTSYTTEEISFTKDAKGQWVSKGDYLNQALTTHDSKVADDIYAKLGWSIENRGSIGELSFVWSATTQYGFKASAFANSKRYATDSWAISPVINLKRAKAPVFLFEEAQKYVGDKIQDFLKVYVSTDYPGRGSLAAIAPNWIDVTDKLVGERPDGSSWDYKPMQLDLSSYAGLTNVHVAFRYVSTEEIAATWEIKNVRCCEKEDLVAE